MPVQRLQKFQSLHRLLTSCPEDVTLNTDIVITLESRGSAAVCFPPDPGVLSSYRRIYFRLGFHVIERAPGSRHRQLNLGILDAGSCQRGDGRQTI